MYYALYAAFACLDSKCQAWIDYCNIQEPQGQVQFLYLVWSLNHHQLPKLALEYGNCFRCCVHALYPMWKNCPFLTVSINPPLFPLSLRWVAGDWGECSVTCGKGAQQREVNCVYQLQNGSFLTTRELYCLSVKPESIQHCEGRHCLTAWDASEWSQVWKCPLVFYRCCDVPYWVQ